MPAGSPACSSFHCFWHVFAKAATLDGLGTGLGVRVRVKGWGWGQGEGGAATFGVARTLALTLALT